MFKVPSRQLPDVCIVIPSLNSPIVDQVIAAIEEQVQAERIAEIAVVGKDELGLVKSSHLVRLIDTGQPVHPGTARNIGIKSTTADLLIFLDSDCLPQPGWLVAHLAAQAAGHPIVGGGVLPDGRNFWGLSYNLAMFHEYFTTGVPGPRDFLPTLNLSVARQVIEVVGLLDEHLPRSQDVDWTTRMNRMGFQPYFWPDAAIQHWHNRTTISRVWRDCARSGYHARRVRLQHREVLHTPFFLRSRLLIMLFAPLIAAWVTGRIVFKNPSTMIPRFYTLPAVFLTKIAWCWGAIQPETTL